MATPWRAAGGGLDVATAVCAVLNLAYFIDRFVSAGGDRLSRRVALFTLALLSFGALAESVVLLAYAAGGHPQPLFDSVQWVAVRLAAFSGTACITALVLSRAARR